MGLGMVSMNCTVIATIPRAVPQEAVGLSTGLRLWQACWRQRQRRASCAGRCAARDGGDRRRGEAGECHAAQFPPREQVEELLMSLLLAYMAGSTEEHPVAT